MMERSWDLIREAVVERIGLQLRIVAVLGLALGIGLGLGLGSELVQMTGTRVAMANQATETVVPQPSGTPTPTAPTTAMPPPSPTCTAEYCGRNSVDLLQEVDLVFEGRVTEVRRLGAERGWGYEVDFDAEQVWKGLVEREYRVLVGHSAWTCDRGFAVDESYVVFARKRPDGGYDIPRCYGVAHDDPLVELGDGVAAEPALAAGHFGGRIRAVVPAPDIPELAWVAQGPRVMAVDTGGRGALQQRSLGLMLDGQVEALAVSGNSGLALAGGVLHLLDLEKPEELLLKWKMALGDLGEFRGPLALFHTADFGFLGFVVHASRGEPARVAAFDMRAGKLLTRDLIPGRGPVIDMIRAGDLLAVTTEAEGMPDEPARLHLLRPGLASIARVAEVDDVAMGRLAGAEVGGEARLYSGNGVSRELVALGLEDPGMPREVQRWTEVVPEQGEALRDLAVTRSGGIYLSVERQVASFYSAGYVRVLEPAPEPPLDDDLHFSLRGLDPRLVAAGDELLVADTVGLGRLDPAAGSMDRLLTAVDAVDVEAGERDGGPMLFTVSDSGGLTWFDAADPLRPEATVELERGLRIGVLQVGAGLATIAQAGFHDIHDNAIDIFELEETDGTPALAGSIDLRNAPSAFRYARSGELLVARASGDGSFRADELSLFDLEDPAAPLRRASLRLGGTIVDLDMRGRLVVVTHEDAARIQA